MVGKPKNYTLILYNHNGLTNYGDVFAIGVNKNINKERKYDMRFFLVLVLTMTIPVFAACPIDGTGEFCGGAGNISFPNTGIDDGLITQPPAPLSSTGIPDLEKKEKQIKESNFSTTRQAKTNPTSRDYSSEEPLRDFRQNNSNYSYNASCQFGICGQTGTPQLFQHRGR